MKQTRSFLLLTLWISLAGSSAPAAETAPVPAEAQSLQLQQLAAEARKIVTQDKIHDLMDRYRKMKDYGLTYQPSLAAPNNLVGQLNEKQLRLYAGIKLMDALYATTFQKRQEVADCIRTIEEIQDALNLRSHADLNQYFLHTLKVAANQPDELDVQQLIEQLASDYILELPDMLSSMNTADYLVDGLYGMCIQNSFTLASLLATENGPRLEEGFSQFTASGFRTMVLELFALFNRAQETLSDNDANGEILDVLRRSSELAQLEESGQLTDEEANPLWIQNALRLAQIRAAILAPAQ